jgi:hypothetical protein
MALLNEEAYREAEWTIQEVPHPFFPADKPVEAKETS